jgi:hypothetical protein
VTTAGGYGTKPIHHSRIDLPLRVIYRQGGELISFVGTIVLHKEGAGSPWSKGRKPLSSRFGMHSQNARDNKLAAEIGLRHLSIIASAALAHASSTG